MKRTAAVVCLTLMLLFSAAQWPLFVNAQIVTPGGGGSGTALPGQVGNDFATVVVTTTTTNDTLRVTGGNFVSGVTNVTQGACSYQITSGGGVGSWFLWETNLNQQVFNFSSGAGVTIAVVGSNCGANASVTPALPTNAGVRPIAAGTIVAGATSSLTITTTYASLNNGWFPACVAGNVNCTPSGAGTMLLDLGTNASTIAGANAYTGTNDFTSSVVAGVPKLLKQQVNANTDQLSTDGGTYNGNASTAATALTAFATTYSYPANLLTANKCLQFDLAFAGQTTATIPTLSGGLYVDTTALFSLSGSAPTAFGTSPNVNNGWGSSFKVCGTAAAGASVPTLTQSIAGFALPTLSTSGMRNVTSQPVSWATNANHTFAFKLIWGSAAAGNNVSLQQFTVYLIN